MIDSDELRQIKERAEAAYEQGKKDERSDLEPLMLVVLSEDVNALLEENAMLRKELKGALHDLTMYQIYHEDEDYD